MRILLIAIALLPGLAGTALAQGRPAPVAEVAAGWVGFADDGIVSETLIGGAGRWYARPRIAIGPEILHLSGPNHSHLVLTGNVTFDLMPSTNAVTPFVVIGAGMFQTNETFFDDAVTSTEGAFTAGGGVRVSAGERVMLGIDVRLGWETHLRVNGSLGVRLGR